MRLVDRKRLEVPLLQLSPEKIIPEDLIWLPSICTTEKPNVISIYLVEHVCVFEGMFTSEGHDFLKVQ